MCRCWACVLARGGKGERGGREGGKRKRGWGDHVCVCVYVPSCVRVHVNSVWVCKLLCGRKRRGRGGRDGEGEIEAALLRDSNYHIGHC